MGIELVHFSDCGSYRKINQDAYLVRIASARCGNLAMAAVCDGMGGLQCGEIASAAVVNALQQWFDRELPQIAANAEINRDKLFGSWGRCLIGIHNVLKTYGIRNGIALGTTLSLLLMTEKHYYTAQVGDSRIYLDDTQMTVRLTHDQTLADRELSVGRITEKEYRVHPGQHTLLQCIGSRDVVPVYSDGILPEKGVFLICSDGFYHYITDRQICTALNMPGGREILKSQLLLLGDRARMCGEKDNMTVAALRWDGFHDMPTKTEILLNQNEEETTTETLVNVSYASVLPPELAVQILGITDTKTIFLEGN